MTNSNLNKDMLRAFYGCPQMSQRVVLDDSGSTGSNLITITFHAIDRTADLIESVTISDYAYSKTPLRPGSGNSISTSLAHDSATKTLTLSVLEQLLVHGSRVQELTIG